MSANVISASDAVASDPRRTVFLDVRSAPGAPSFRPEYDQAHIPGAHFVELSEQLQSAPSRFSGTRPLPSAEALQRNIERWGIHPGTSVIVYSDTTHGAAARAWFVLRWAGVKDVRYLDGGLPGWIRAGGATTGTAPAEGGGTLVLTHTEQLPTLTADGTQELLDAGEVVIDARKAEKFAGESTDEDGNRGRIPGAISVPAGSLLDREDGTLRDASALRERFGRLGLVPDRPVGVYCGGSVAAALATLALTEAGYSPRLFVGSFSAWASDPSRLVEPVRYTEARRTT